MIHTSGADESIDNRERVCHAAKGSPLMQKDLDLAQRAEQLLFSLDRPKEVLAQLRARLVEEKLFFGSELLPTFLRPHFIDATFIDAMIDASERLFQLI